MRLEFTRLILRDFKEYRGKHVLNLSSLGNGVHYVRGHNAVDALGSNGAGKSTLWDAFMWAICGRTVRGLRGTDVRTWEGDEHAMSRVDFYRGADHHWVKRSTEKNGLWLDGKLCSQDEIDRLIGLTIINIPHTIILGQKQDLFFDLTPSKKLEVLSETLNLDKWDVRSKRARERTLQIETQWSSINFHLAQMKLTIESKREALAVGKDRVAEWEKERSQADSKREQEQDRLIKALAKTTAEVGTHDLAYDSAETELRAARKDLTKRSADRDVINDEITAAKVKAATRKKTYETLKELAESDICPTCNQHIASKHQHAHSAKLNVKDAKHKAAVASDLVIVAETKLELHDRAMARVRKSIDEFATKSDDAKDKLDRLTAQIAAIKQEIAVVKASTREHEVNPHSELVATLRKQIKECKQQIEEQEELSDKLQRRMTRTKYWIDGFKQVRLYLLQETLEELQEVTQNMLPALGLTGWTVEYAIERDTKAGGVSTGLTVTILKPGMSKAVRWEAWSGGEGQRLLIVGAMALSEVLLRRAGIECDLLVLDEPTRHMSKEGIAETVDYLIERGRDGQVFYVDHQVVESNRFASVITVEKNDDGAKIEVEAG